MYETIIEATNEYLALIVTVGVSALLVFLLREFREISESLKTTKFGSYLQIVENFIYWQLNALIKSDELEPTLQNIDSFKDRIFSEVSELLERRNIPVDVEILNKAVEDSIESFLLENFEIEIEFDDDSVVH